MEKDLSKPSKGCLGWFVVILSIFLIGCVGVSGKLKSNPTLLTQYKDRALSKTYNYYYCGRSSLPYAVVGIDNTYGFNDRLWFKIESEQAVYEKIRNLSDLEIDSFPMAGADILDGQGNKIGVWFSHYRHTPVRVDDKSRKVEVFNPYNPNDEYRGKLFNRLGNFSISFKQFEQFQGFFQKFVFSQKGDPGLS